MKTIVYISALRYALALCAVVMIGAGSPLLAQTTLKGTVSNAKSGDVLPGASIVVQGLNKGAASRKGGEFEIKGLPAGSYDVRVSLLGYKPKTQKVTLAGDVITLAIKLDEAVSTLDEAVVLGTRRSDRTVIESPVPIDVISAKEMRMTGLVETAQLLQMNIPSLNFPRPAISDGTDALRPATIRGMSPDQTLVLVNGKRRHIGALVHVNGTVGRGATGVDLNAIPANMIERVEVLRDGAAAQYGSDAIGGVINVILRKDAGISASTTVGQTSRGDGTVTQGNLNYGTAIGNDGGALHIGFEFRRRDSTNRTFADLRRMATGTGIAGDGTDWASTDPRRVNHWAGDSRTQDLGGFYNFTLPLSASAAFYSFGGLTYRESESYGFFRTPRDARNDIRVFANGFLPQIYAKLLDVSVGGGVKGEMSGWNYDLSAVYGRNSFNFNVRNSWNASLGPTSPREFDAGTLLYNQTSFNFDVSKAVEVSGFAKPLNIAFGSEFRLENYQIQAGEAASWQNQANDAGAGTPPVITTRVPGTQDGANGLPAPGAQVFPGFKPQNATNQSRSNFSIYADFETDPVKNWTVSLAGRFESYSDFGSLFTWKFTTRYELFEGFALRGAVSTGFRAPSLQQQFFTATSTNFINGVPFDISTFPPASSAGAAFGATALKPEKSVNISGGFTMDNLINNLSFTFDVYNIEVTDRITLTGNFTGDSVRALLGRNGITGVGGGRFFSNLMDLRTTGLDAILRYAVPIGENTLRFTAAFNWNQNQFTRLSGSPAPLARLEGVNGGIPVGNANAWFDRGEQVRFIEGQPRTSLNLSINYNVGDLGLMLRGIRFGEVRVVNQIPIPELDQVVGGKFVTDIDISYNLSKIITPGLSVGIGANNLFDVMPQTWTQWQSNGVTWNAATGQPTPIATATGYANVPLPTGVPATNFGTTGTVFQYINGGAPWGMGGRYMYFRVAYSLQ